MFSDYIYEEIKEENKGEGSDKEDEKNDKKVSIIDNLEYFNIININEEENKDEKKSEEPKIEKPRKHSIVDQNVILNLEIDENITNSVNQSKEWNC